VDQPGSDTLTLEMITVPPGFLAALSGTFTWTTAQAIEQFFLLEASLQPSWAVLDLSRMEIVDTDALGCLDRLSRAFADVGSHLELRGVPSSA
jgi:MFS superfamily sulfate permease-like transporter